MHCSCCGSTSKIDHPSTCYQTQGNRCSCSSHQEDEETDEVSRPDSLNTRTKTWDHSIKQSNDTNFAQRTCACSQDIRDDHQPKNKNINDQVVDTFEYRVYGMDCTACAKTLEKSISRLPAIKEVNVNFNTAKMTVSLTSAATIQLIETEVQKLGYRVEPMNQNDDVQTYVIQGMDCSSCAKRIENHFKTLSYVMDVSVNFSTGKMRIEHNSTVEEIIAEVKKIGYKATIDTPSSYRSEKNYRELVTVIVSGVFMGLGLMGSIIGFESKIPIACYAIAMVVSGYKPFKSAVVPGSRSNKRKAQVKAAERAAEYDQQLRSPKEVSQRIKQLEEEMYQLARDLEFEAAAQLRDEIQRLRLRLLDI